jgi:transcriptional regulator NrdR family protein
MKCPECGVWSVVKETRGTRRRRECANEHRFTTEEVVIPEEVLKQNSANNIKAHHRKKMVALR